MALKDFNFKVAMSSNKFESYITVKDKHISNFFASYMDYVNQHGFMIIVKKMNKKTKDLEVFGIFSTGPVT